MATHELYDLLSVGSAAVLDVTKLGDTISALKDNIHREEILALIIHHAAKHGHGRVNERGEPAIPYDGIILPGGKGNIFSMSKLPTELLYILSAYVERYSKVQ